MWRRAVREAVVVEVEEEGFGGAPLGTGALFGWLVVMLLEVGSIASNCCVAAIVVNVEHMSIREVGVASALICRGISAL